MSMATAGPYGLGTLVTQDPALSGSVSWVLSSDKLQLKTRKDNRVVLCPVSRVVRCGPVSCVLSGPMSGVLIGPVSWALSGPVS